MCYLDYWCWENNGSYVIEVDGGVNVEIVEKCK